MGLVWMKVIARSISFELHVELGGLMFPCCGLCPDGATCWWRLFFSVFLTAICSKSKVVEGKQRGNGLRESNSELLFWWQVTLKLMFSPRHVLFLLGKKSEEKVEKQYLEAYYLFLYQHPHSFLLPSYLVVSWKTGGCRGPLTAPLLLVRLLTSTCPLHLHSTDLQQILWCLCFLTERPEYFFLNNMRC